MEIGKAGGGGIAIYGGYIYGEYYINGSYRGISSTVKPVLNQIYHAALTYDGTNVILYVNGIEQGRVSQSGVIKAPDQCKNTDTVMALGVNPNGAFAETNYLDGKIYSAAVYNKGLTAAQVQANAKAGLTMAGGPTNAETITYTIRFPNQVTGFTIDDINVTNGTKGATLTTVTEGLLYTVQVATVANQNNTQVITIPAHAVNSVSGGYLIDSDTSKSVRIDRAAPQKTSAEVKNVTSSGYDVYVYGVVDTGSGVNRVQFPTWTLVPDPGGNTSQDDIQSKWETNPTSGGVLQADGTTWVYHVDVADHKSEAGTYRTHIYLYDNLGNKTSMSVPDTALPGVKITYASENLLYGLDEDVPLTTDSLGRMKYSITNKVVTVTALCNDGYGYPPGRVDLEAGKTYRFSCNADGTWAGNNISGVEAFLMKDGLVNKYYHMASNNGFEFTPTESGTYWLRLDVNANGETHTFSNIQINEVYGSRMKSPGGQFKELWTTPTKNGYSFDGWYDAPEGGTKITTTSTIPISDKVYYAHWIANGSN